MAGYTKLFYSIVASTIWRENKETKIVWITLLAMANAQGRVDASVPGLADLSRVTLEECQAALAVLTSPDSWSRSPEFEGRRIEAVEGGWQILNYAKYRENRDPEIRREQNREAQARYRQRKQVSHSKPKVSRNKPQSAQAEAEAEAEAIPRAADKPPNPRNPLIDALAVAEGIPLDQISSPVGSRLAKALSIIRQTSFEVTVEEISRRATNLRLHHDGASCTAMSLANHWGKCHEAPSISTAKRTPGPTWR